MGDPSSGTPEKNELLDLFYRRHFPSDASCRAQHTQHKLRHVLGICCGPCLWPVLGEEKGDRGELVELHVERYTNKGQNFRCRSETVVRTTGSNASYVRHVVTVGSRASVHTGRSGSVADRVFAPSCMMIKDARNFTSYLQHKGNRGPTDTARTQFEANWLEWSPVLCRS